MTSRRLAWIGRSVRAAAAIEHAEMTVSQKRQRPGVQTATKACCAGAPSRWACSEYEPRTIRAWSAGDPHRWACALARLPRLSMPRALCHRDEQPEKQRHRAAQRFGIQLPRARHTIGEIAVISRAKRSAGCACWARLWYCFTVISLYLLLPKRKKCKNV